ncbi:hypothetical protein FPSE_11130 [Fusarium pseudograminearum CS3096]|uniref:Uncharacterized protein n=1 Tax=Fusarium pseudograminearum (strain CS3096) TaxID=1028729 RepID=K3V6H0_FUSPC|nr:hypothetical protein FPSE_11130 [Fusarium pseudograminearum CS3096]EKJ68684.1 hypothetical protein FPSE_11130 [Fusarium pseudograminearum CS3096]
MSRQTPLSAMDEVQLRLRILDPVSRPMYYEGSPNGSSYKRLRILSIY